MVMGRANTMSVCLLTLLLSFSHGVYGKDKKEREEKPKDSYSVIQKSGGGVVRVNNRVLRQLAFLYDGLDRELAFCLYGVHSNRFTSIDRLEVPDYLSSTEDSVQYSVDVCSRKRLIGTVHNHPSGTCMPSDHDMAEFSQDFRKVSMVVCRASREEGQIEYVVMTKKEPDLLGLEGSFR